MNHLSPLALMLIAGCAARSPMDEPPLPLATGATLDLHAVQSRLWLSEGRAGPEIFEARLDIAPGEPLRSDPPGRLVVQGVLEDSDGATLETRERLVGTLVDGAGALAPGAESTVTFEFSPAAVAAAARFRVAVIWEAQSEASAGVPRVILAAQDQPIGVGWTGTSR